MSYHVPRPPLPATDPPPSPVARALRAIGRNLDALGRGLGLIRAQTAALSEMGNADHAEQKATLGRIEGKLDAALSRFGELADRVDTLERWRGEHARDHAREQ